MATGKRCMFTLIYAIITALIIENQCRLHHLVLKVTLCVCCARNVAIEYSYSPLYVTVSSLLFTATDAVL